MHCQCFFVHYSNSFSKELPCFQMQCFSVLYNTSSVRASSYSYYKIWSAITNKQMGSMMKLVNLQTQRQQHNQGSNKHWTTSSSDWAECNCTVAHRIDTHRVNSQWQLPFAQARGHRWKWSKSWLAEPRESKGHGGGRVLQKPISSRT